MLFHRKLLDRTIDVLIILAFAAMAGAMAHRASHTCDQDASGFFTSTAIAAPKAR